MTPIRFKIKGFKINFMQWKIVVVLLLLLSVASCASRVVYDDVVAVDGETWDINNKVRLEFNVDDTTNTNLFFVHVRNKTTYRYSNLYLFMQTRFPNGNITKDTIECILADPSGKWLGKGSGPYRENMILLNASLKFPLKGKYVMDIEQAMRDEKLSGITDVGIRIERNPN